MSNVNAEVSSSRTDANVDVATTNTEADKDQQEEVKRKEDLTEKAPAKDVNEESKLVAGNGTKPDSSAHKEEMEAAESNRRKTSEGDEEETPSKRHCSTSVTAETSAKSARKRTKSMDNDDVEEVIRKRCILMLLKCLGESEKAEVVAKKVSFDVELAVYEEFGDANDHRYRSRVRSRISNLTRNPAIAQQLIDGTICPEKFAKMTAEELATPQLKKLREHLSEDTMEEHMMGENEKVGIGNIKKSDNAI